MHEIEQETIFFVIEEKIVIIFTLFHPYAIIQQCYSATKKMQYLLTIRCLKLYLKRIKYTTTITSKNNHINHRETHAIYFI